MSRLTKADMVFNFMAGKCYCDSLKKITPEWYVAQHNIECIYCKIAQEMIEYIKCQERDQK